MLVEFSEKEYVLTALCRPADGAVAPELGLQIGASVPLGAPGTSPITFQIPAGTSPATDN